MQTFIALHLQNPAMTWLAIAALFIAFSLASGLARLMAPALGAAAAAAVCALAPHLGSAAQGAVFVAATLALVGAHVARRRLMIQKTGPAAPAAPLDAAPADQTPARVAARPEQEAPPPGPEPLFADARVEDATLVRTAAAAASTDATVPFVRRSPPAGASDDAEPEQAPAPHRRAAGL